MVTDSASAKTGNSMDSMNWNINAGTFDSFMITIVVDFEYLFKDKDF